MAKARGISVDQINQLVAQYTKSPDLGLLGEPRVNVLKLNLALDQQISEEVIRDTIQSRGDTHDCLRSLR